MAKWLVRFKGERFDLEDLPSLLRSPELNITEENGFYYLQSSEFDSLTSSDEVLVTKTELWKEKIWHALRHLDDLIILNQSSLARLVYVQRLAETEFRDRSLARGLALRHALTGCIDKIVSDGKDQIGLQKICGFLEIVKEGQNLTDISKAMGVSREQVSKSYKKKAVELVTQEFVELAKSRRK